MAKKKPTAAELNAQIASITSKLQTVTNDRNVLVNPNANTYFQQNQEQKLDDVTLSRYTDVYNTQFDSVKDIQMTVGVDAQDRNSSAFFVFNPADEAKKVTEAQLAEEKAKKDAYDAQQEKIKTWIKDRQSSQDMAIFNMYFNSMLETQYEGLSDGYITSDSPLFNESKFRAANSRNRFAKVVPVRSGPRTVMKSIRGYRDPQAAQTMRTSLQEMYMQTFNADANLKKKWTSEYTQSLQRQQTDLRRQLNQLTKKKK